LLIYINEIMRAKTESLPSFSGAGLLATFVSVCQIFGGLVWVNSPAFSSSGYVNIALIASLCCSVLVLARLTIPNVVRAILVLGVIAVLLGVAVRGDITGVKKVSEAVSAVLRLRSNSVVLPDEQRATSHRKSATAALVDLQPGPGGDGGWSARLNDAARAQLDSGAPAEIHGNVTLDGSDATRPRIGWSIRWNGATAPCGRLSAMAHRPEQLASQVIGTFKRAADRTATIGRPICY
jgi:hypothetical protein